MLREMFDEEVIYCGVLPLGHGFVGRKDEEEGEEKKRKGGACCHG